MEQTKWGHGMMGWKPALFSATLILTLGGLNELIAQQIVARDLSNAYQTNPRHHVHHVLLYNYTLGGHSMFPMLNSMIRLANKYGFQLDTSKNPSYIHPNLSGSPSTLAGVDVAVFSNGDGDVLSNASSLTAMKTFVQDSGKGLLQSHSADWGIPCPTTGQDDLTDPNCRWLARILVRHWLNGDLYPNMARIYVDSTRAGEYPPNSDNIAAGHVLATINHGKTNPEFQGIFKGLPSNNGVVGGANPEVWDSLGDEWYNFRGYVRQQGEQTFSDNPNVVFGPVVCLMALDETAPYYKTSYAKMGDRVMVWGRHVGKGLTAFNDAGHDNIYTHSRQVGGVAVNDSVEEKINWNLIRYLARDFVGCMDPNYNEYNSEATVTLITPSIDDPAPCKTLKGTSIYKLVHGKVFPGITLSQEGMKIPTLESGTYRVVVTNASGEKLFSKTVIGGKNKAMEVPNLDQGVYYIEIHSPQSGTTVTRVTY